MKYYLATKILFSYLKKCRRFTTLSEGSPLIWFHLYTVWASQVVLMVKNLPANTGDARDMDSIPGSGISPGGGHGNPLRYSCLENPLDRGAWGLTVHSVAKSRIQLKILSTHTHTPTMLTTSWVGLAFGTCVASDGAGWKQEVSHIQGVEAKVWLWPWVDLYSRSVYPLWYTEFKSEGVSVCLCVRACFSRGGSSAWCSSPGL